jgi:hypothetical protein
MVRRDCGRLILVAPRVPSREQGPACLRHESLKAGLVAKLIRRPLDRGRAEEIDERVKREPDETEREHQGCRGDDQGLSRAMLWRGRVHRLLNA